MIFDRVVVISLARRPDRLEAFLDRFSKAWPGQMVEIEPAVDGELEVIPAWWKQSPGAWGCYRSHEKILADAELAGLGSVLIFEDDATFCDGFVDRLGELLDAVPDDWAQLYLGGQHLRGPRSCGRRGVVRGVNVNRTHAYAIRGTDRISEAWSWLQPGDHWGNGGRLARHHVDHHWGRLQARGSWPVYAPREWLCGQAAGLSDVRGCPVEERLWSL